KVYADDGINGLELNRPGLNDLRADLKAHLFEAVYVRDIERLSRKFTQRHLILSEIRAYGRQVLVNGKDYDSSSEFHVARLVDSGMVWMSMRGWHKHASRSRQDSSLAFVDGKRKKTGNLKTGSDRINHPAKQ